MIGALALLVGLQLLGMAISYWTGLPVPGAVIGLVLLFIALALVGVDPTLVSPAAI